MRTRLLIAFAFVVTFLAGWQYLEKIPVQVVGQPSTTGFIQKQFEEPFFAHLAEQTGLPLEISYVPNNELGIKDTYQLLMLKSGTLELVSLRFLQNSIVEPMLLGLDLVGATSDSQTAQAVAEAYAPILDQQLQERFDAKLLGVWPFGPQVFFCRTPVNSLKDLAGLKIRVGSENFGSLISFFEARAVVIPFEDTQTALETGLVDCAITSITSGNAAGWPQHATHLFDLGMQFGINGYVISLKLWNRLSQSQQEALQAAFQQYSQNIWSQVERLHQEMKSCTVGGPCEKGTPYHLHEANPTAEDRQRLRDAFVDTTFKAWAERCDAIRPGCSLQWQERIGPILQGNPP